jgi:signal transduction histidine kinase/CHASE2 domain-containing sensor protein
MPESPQTGGGRKRAAALAAIVIGAAVLGVLVSWRAPGIDLYARDWLMQLRGSLPVPDDIAIVAIDEASIARFGRFPWTRTLAARAIDNLAAAQPRAIAVDILYIDPTTPADDAALARSIGQAGNVVVAAQLADSPAGGSPVWLLPLPGIQQAAAATGHVNVSTESEGIGRQVLVREANDAGETFRAMAVEAVRVGDRVPEEAVIDTPGQLLVGKRAIPVETGFRSVAVASKSGRQATLLPAGRLTIDYIGPAGSFAPRTYSMADVIEGKVPATAFRGKYVLVGATAASLGDRLASPFVHQADARPDQHGSLMPGVEVLANSLNTILRARYYSGTPDSLAWLLAAGIAALTLGLLSAAQGRYEGLKQCLALAGLGCGIVVAGFAWFSQRQVFPPLTAGMVSFASAGLLGLLRRSLATSSKLDASIAEISLAGHMLAPESAAGGVAESVARLTGAAGVAIFAGEGQGMYRLTGASGLPVLARLRHGRPVPLDLKTPQTARFFAGGGRTQETSYETTLLPLQQAPGHEGVLALAHPLGSKPSPDAVLLAAAMATASCAAIAPGAPSNWWPRGVEWKAQALARLNSRLLERTRFVDLALRSVDDGLIIAGADGRISFANPRAAGILGATAGALNGRDLLERLAEAENGAGAAVPVERNATLAKLLLDRAAIEREIAIRGVRTSYYTLRLAAVTSASNGHGPVLGIVASLSDITRQRELQKTKDDVVALVSHEMRTPLTAIQGMSELLAQYEMDPARRREMYVAINEEAKRLARMTGDYLDIARLESGATEVRRSAVRLDALVERTVLLLSPLAAEKNIHLEPVTGGGVQPVLADADLLARAVGNLVSNAIKYSPRGTTVTISVQREAGAVTIAVADQGYGIAHADLERIFDKFYRVPRVQDAGTPGTGLGLALVREIAELHNGSVSVTSVMNSGSTFALRIPEVLN